MIKIDIGFVVLTILASIVGSIIQFWISVYKEEAEITQKHLSID